MILRSVKLENIRSYVNETIEFPEGSVLLAGDIGSGKSSILQAIEFALFGIKREMPGSSLLRHGKSKGSVELRFSLNGREILIKRNLKRAKQGIGQESGYIVIDGLKKEGTATELKTVVFELLGYPKSLVSKSKDLIYRYTVYTPQEEMKAILTDDKESRLDTLRRVFSIDKYKRIKENSVILTRALKEEIKRKEGLVEDLEEKKKEKQEKTREKKELNGILGELLPGLKLKKESLDKTKEGLKKIEKEIEELRDIKNELRINDNELQHKVEQRERNRKKFAQLEKEIEELNQDESIKLTVKIEDVKAKIAETQKAIELAEGKNQEAQFRINEIQIKHSHSEEVKEKILSLNVCPTCRQEVSETHKHDIISAEDKRISELKKSMVVHEESSKASHEKLQKLKKELDELKATEKSVDLIRFKLKSLNEKISLSESLVKEQEEIKQAIGKINASKIRLNEKLKDFESLEQGYDALKKEFEQLQKEAHSIELEKVSVEKEIEGIDKSLLRLNGEIEKKTKEKEKIKGLAETENWLNDFFINLVSLMEKQVMLKLHSEFNELFQNWFNILIEDETIAARLDDEFTPVIEQNGYETEMENLSGGERTSLALAYRLSLNKVINDFIETIKTKDIIILDEPTDGFSTEQLDKVRDVLEQLNITQVIIVSHETKIESFVENIVRIQKEEHVSRAV